MVRRRETKKRDLARHTQREFAASVRAFASALGVDLPDSLLSNAVSEGRCTTLVRRSHFLVSFPFPAHTSLSPFDGLRFRPRSNRVRVLLRRRAMHACMRFTDSRCQGSPVRCHLTATKRCSTLPAATFPTHVCYPRWFQSRALMDKMLHCALPLVWYCLRA
jgi:hypothetical protein